MAARKAAADIRLPVSGPADLAANNVTGRKVVAKKVPMKKSSIKKMANPAPARPARVAPLVPAEVRIEGERAFWLFKSEPDKFSWDDLVAKGAEGEEWDGVRNYQARNHMRSMQIGDLGFFYHSNAGKEVVGICEVCALAHADSTTDDERWECVDLRAICPVPVPVTLADVKSIPKLSEMSLVTSMRLSVQPVTEEQWRIVCAMGEVDAASYGGNNTQR